MMKKILCICIIFSIVTNLAPVLSGTVSCDSNTAAKALFGKLSMQCVSVFYNMSVALANNFLAEENSFPVQERTEKSSNNSNENQKAAHIPASGFSLSLGLSGITTARQVVSQWSHTANVLMHSLLTGQSGGIPGNFPFWQFRMFLMVFLVMLFYVMPRGAIDYSIISNLNRVF